MTAELYGVLMGLRRLLPGAFILLLSVACGGDGPGARGSSTTISTAGETGNCAADQLIATLNYGRALAQLSDRGEAINARLGADLNTLTSRALTLDDAETPAALRNFRRQYTALGTDLRALGVPPPAYAPAVDILSKALETVAAGLETMAYGADQKSEASFREGLSGITTGFNLLPQASAALDASPLC